MQKAPNLDLETIFVFPGLVCGNGSRTHSPLTDVIADQSQSFVIAALLN
jgi:hypothetical protein